MIKWSCWSRSVQYYNKLSNGTEGTSTEDHGSGRIGYVGILKNSNQATHTSREVMDAVQQLNNKKAAGEDGIKAEFIQMRPEKLFSSLHRLIVTI